MWWALLGSAASAQTGPTWAHDELVTGVTNDEFAVAVGQKQWGPTDELFLVFQLYDEVSATQRLYLKGYDCNGSTDCDTLRNTWGPDLLTTVFADHQVLQPAVAVRSAGSGELAVHVVHRDKLNTDCDDDGTHYALEASTDEDPDNLDLQEQVWLTSENSGAGGVAGTRVVLQNPTNTCEDNGVSVAKWRSDTAFAAWTHKVDKGLSTEINDVFADERDTSSQGNWNAGGTRISMPNPTDDIVDHPWMDFDGTSTERVIAYHENAGTHKIKLAFADRAGLPVANLGSGGNYPFVDGVGDDFYVGYTKELGGTDDVVFGECDDSAVDCTDGSNWTVTTPHQGDDVRGVEFRSDGDKQFLLFVETVDTGQFPDKPRAHVMWRCDGNSWEGPAEVDVGSSSGQLHHLAYGRAHLGIDRGDDILYVALIETTDTSLQTDGNVISARAPYTACGGGWDSDF